MGPLLTIAEVAGGDWPQRAHRALLGQADVSEPTRAMQLLMDARGVLREHEDRIGTKDLIERLVGLEDSPWSDYNFRARDEGRRIKTQQVAKLLKRYGVTHGSVRFGDVTRKGYKRSDLDKAWARYRPPKYPAQRHNPYPIRVLATSYPAQAFLVCRIE
jgi:hypothetical protein